MRSAAFLALLASLASASASAQMIELEGVGERNGPNARAVQRHLGPNAQAAQRPGGQNGASARTGKLAGQDVRFASCGAVRAVRAAPVRRGEPGYGRHLDPDGDGVACQ